MGQPRKLPDVVGGIIGDALSGFFPGSKIPTAEVVSSMMRHTFGEVATRLVSPFGGYYGGGAGRDALSHLYEDPVGSLRNLVTTGLPSPRLLVLAQMEGQERQTCGARGLASTRYSLGVSNRKALSTTIRTAHIHMSRIRTYGRPSRIGCVTNTAGRLKTTTRRTMFFSQQPQIRMSGTLDRHCIKILLRRSTISGTRRHIKTK